MKMSSKNTVSISLIALLVSALFLQAEVSIAQDKKADGKVAAEGKTAGAGKPALIEIRIDPEAISPNITLAAITAAAVKAAASTATK